MLSQRDGGGVKAQVGKNEGKWYLTHRILGARAGGGEEWVWGGQKADPQRFMEQRPVGWEGGPKRETRGAIEDPGIG